ncbi:19167_t:CDS:1, partial [Racocetra fulgida]
KDTKLEKVIRQQIPVKDETGKVLYGCFDYVYFCSNACQMLGEKHIIKPN